MTPPPGPERPASALRPTPAPGFADAHRFHESDRFLTLGDGVVRRLLDVLLRLDTIRGVLEASDSTNAQVTAARTDLSALVAELENHIRVSNSAMLDITSTWPITEPRV
ncbi:MULTISPECIES: hypothetical protein [unclassified Nocardia]|uniref:hypothetical protein n=1 Tax=unclassified Nocardia TaxID=2637762 RepID=UPI0024A88206|nr:MULTISPECIES: hypothetical protein [unclassified Nocardia]